MMRSVSLTSEDHSRLPLFLSHNTSVLRRRCSQATLSESDRAVVLTELCTWCTTVSRYLRSDRVSVSLSLSAA